VLIGRAGVRTGLAMISALVLIAAGTPIVTARALL
jgi:hypothetical protein